MSEYAPEELSLEVNYVMSAEMKKAADAMTHIQARYFVDSYYQIQDKRIAAAAQEREAKKRGEPHELLAWNKNNFTALENRWKYLLNRFVNRWNVGRWMMSICGIGPVTSAGILAHLDVRRAPHAGHFYSYCGLAPNIAWEKGKKRPWNADAKVLCYKIGESFVKVQNNKNDFYGQHYVAAKKEEWAKNLRGENEEQALAGAERVAKSTFAYKWYSGKFDPLVVADYLQDGAPIPQTLEVSKRNGLPMLPPNHIHSRARRKTVKLFLSHLHHVMHEDMYGAGTAPEPYVMGLPENHRFIPPPNWPYDFGGLHLRDMYRDEEKESKTA